MFNQQTLCIGAEDQQQKLLDLPSGGQVVEAALPCLSRRGDDRVNVPVRVVFFVQPCNSHSLSKK